MLHLRAVASRARAAAPSATGGLRARRKFRPNCCARDAPLLPEVSELDAVRHYTRLSQRNFSIDTHFYPLGSCTMKYNPRACNAGGCCRSFWRAIRWRRQRPDRDFSLACSSCRRC